MTQITTPPLIPNLSLPVPQRTDPENFSVRMDLTLTEIPETVDGMNAMSGWMTDMGGLVLGYLQDAEQWHADTKAEADRSEAEADRSRDEANRAAAQVGLAADQVGLAAAQVGLATAEVGRAADEADRAQAEKEAAQDVIAAFSGDIELPERVTPRAPLVAMDKLNGARFDDYEFNAGGVNVKPYLSFDFVNQKTLDPRIEYSRLSTATYWGADGNLHTADINEPRFEYDPLTGEPRGFLVEGPGVNLIRRSEEPSIYVAHGGDGEDGGLLKGVPSYKLTSFGAGSAHSHYPYLTAGGVDAENSYSLSAIIDTSGLSLGASVTFRLHASHFGMEKGIKLTNESGGVLAQGTGSQARYTCTEIGGDIWAVSVTGRPIESREGGAYPFTLILANGHDGDYVRIAAPQLEEGVAATSYIPTYGTEVARAADDLLGVESKPRTIVMEMTPPLGIAGEFTYALYGSSAAQSRPPSSFRANSKDGSEMRVGYKLEGEFNYAVSAFDMPASDARRVGLSSYGNTIAMAINGKTYARTREKISEIFERVSYVQLAPGARDAESFERIRTLRRVALYDQAMTLEQLEELTR